MLHESASAEHQGMKLHVLLKIRIMLLENVQEFKELILANDSASEHIERNKKLLVLQLWAKLQCLDMIHRMPLTKWIFTFVVAWKRQLRSFAHLKGSCARKTRSVWGHKMEKTWQHQCFDRPSPLVDYWYTNYGYSPGADIGSTMITMMTWHHRQVKLPDPNFRWDLPTCIPCIPNSYRLGKPALHLNLCARNESCHRSATNGFNADPSTRTCISCINNICIREWDLAVR